MATIRTSVDLALESSTAFDTLVEQLTTALERLGMVFEPGAGGRVVQGGFEVGRIVAWNPGRGFSLEWHPAEWNPAAVAEIELKLDSQNGGTLATLEIRGWGGLIGDAGEIAGWFAAEVVAPLLHSAAPSAFGDWITDRRARRPSGAQSRAIYRDPLYHYPNFRVILAELALTGDDYLLEVGCGGGALLRDALKSGCRAAAIDHSPEMVRLAREANRESVASGRLAVLDGRADALPFPDDAFSCAVMTGVLGFLPDPVAAFSEIRRVLARGGRLVALGSDPEMKGTPAAPEPMGSRLRFYDAAQLETLGRQAGFIDVRVVLRDLEPFARAAGVPEEHLPLFASKPGGGTSFLLARKR